MRVRKIAAIALVASMMGCVSQINQKEADMHFQAAQRFDIQGDYVSASEQYWKALADARLAGASPAVISMLTYNFGRTAGYTCRLDLAEKYLLKALTMEEPISGPDSGITTKRLFELARFYFDRSQYDKAASYYARGIPAVEKLGLAESDPIALADALDEYSIALEKSDRAQEAIPIKRKATQVRSANSGKTPRFVPVRYRCEQRTG